MRRNAKHGNLFKKHTEVQYTYNLKCKHSPAGGTPLQSWHFGAEGEASQNFKAI